MSTHPHPPRSGRRPHRDGDHRPRRLARRLQLRRQAGTATAAATATQADKITVWIEEDLPDRVAATQAIVDHFQQRAASRSSWPRSPRTSSARSSPQRRAGDLPDVMGGVPLGRPAACPPTS